MIAAAVLAGQLATYPSGSYIDDVRQTVVIVYQDHVTVERGGYSVAHTVKSKRLKNGVVEFKYGGKTYRATLRTNGTLDVKSTGAKGTFSGIYVH